MATPQPAHRSRAWRGSFSRAAGVSDWLVDTGYADGVADLAQVAEVSANRAHEVVRLEQVAEQAADSPGDYASAFEHILRQRTATAVGTKSVLAYRGGFDGDLTEPSAAEVATAAARWRDDGGRRLTDRVLLRFGLHQALRVGKPLQFHVGFGDRECDLHKTNPLLLLDFLRQSGETPIVLLHCYPYEREAGYLAQAFNNVYLDGGLSINHLGARSPAFIARLLELAPFRKIVYSSDGFGPAELHYLCYDVVAQRYSPSAERIRRRRRLECERRHARRRPDRRVTPRPASIGWRCLNRYKRRSRRV